MLTLIYFRGLLGILMTAMICDRFIRPIVGRLIIRTFFWQEAMELLGAKQMNFVRKLMESRPMLDRVPNQSLIVELTISLTIESKQLVARIMHLFTRLRGKQLR